VNAIHVERAARVWNELIEIFGTQFTGTFGMKPLAAWIESISILTDAEIRHGFAQIKIVGADFPPNLSKFNWYCRSLDTRNQEQKARDAQAAQFKYPALPHKTDHSEMVKRVNMQMQAEDRAGLLKLKSRPNDFEGRLAEIKAMQEERIQLLKVGMG
jgi:hypothetical protein